MLGIQPRDCSKLVKNQKMTTTSQFSDMTSMSTFFDVVFFFFLVKFSCWSKFHVNTITGSAIMTIFFYKWLTRNPEIGNTPVWALPNIWRLGLVTECCKMPELQLLPFLGEGVKKIKNSFIGSELYLMTSTWNLPNVFSLSSTKILKLVGKVRR